MEVIDPDLQGHFGHLNSAFMEFWLVRAITFDGFELDPPNAHQICIKGFSQLVLKMGGIDLDLQGHLAISTHKTTFNVALVHWSRPAKVCYTPQTCSCSKDWPKQFYCIGKWYTFGVLKWYASAEGNGSSKIPIYPAHQIADVPLMITDAWTAEALCFWKSCC